MPDCAAAGRPWCPRRRHARRPDSRSRHARGNKYLAREHGNKNPVRGRWRKPETQPYRPTRDIDFLEYGEASKSALARAVDDIASTEVPDDGMLFDLKT